MYYKIINLIKLNLLLKNKILTTRLNKNDFKILKIFIKLNIIKHIKKYKNNTYILYINSENLYKNIINLYKPSQPISINYKTIIKINRKKNNIFYISSNLGIINNIEAENKKIGGFLLMSILI